MMYFDSKVKGGGVGDELPLPMKLCARGGGWGDTWPYDVLRDDGYEC